VLSTAISTQAESIALVFGHTGDEPVLDSILCRKPCRKPLSNWKWA